MVEVSLQATEKQSGWPRVYHHKAFSVKGRGMSCVVSCFFCVLVPALAQTLITNRSNRVVNDVIGNIVSYVIVTWFITLRSPSCSLTCGLTTCGRVALMENKRCSLSIEN